MPLPFPLYSGFFPQMVLNLDELMQYRRLSKERVFQLARIIDDADCAYCWTDLKARNGRCVQKAQFVDISPATKQLASKQPSTLFKCSAHIVDVQPEEILKAIAKVKTRDARKTMSYLHSEQFVDTQTLLTFPASSELKKPGYSYRAIKWCLLKGRPREGQEKLDFCYLEYAGKCKAKDTSNSVVGFCIQESIAKNREVPTLERYDILRGQFVRSGIVITKTHQSNILKVAAIAQVHGAMKPPAVRMTMEETMVEFVAVVHRVKGLLERQRMSSLHYLDVLDWIPTKDRKACAVCLRGFYFHRKHHCATCGEVVCSNCAPLRELEEPLDEHTRCMRVCSVCMAQAGGQHDSNILSGSTRSVNDMLKTATSTTNIGTETYVEGLRYPIDHGVQNKDSKEVLHGSSLPSALVRLPLPPFRQRHHIPSAQRNDVDFGDASNAQLVRAAPGIAQPKQHSSIPRYLALSTSTMSAQAKQQALSMFVKHARQVCATMNIAILEAEKEKERHSMFVDSGCGDSNAGAERCDEIVDCIIKIREALKICSLRLDAVLNTFGHNDHVCPSDADPDRSGSDLAFCFSDQTGSEHSSAIISESIDFYSSRSSLLSPSVQSSIHQDAGEPLPSPTPAQNSAIEEVLALQEAMQWVCQSEPTTTVRPFRLAPSMHTMTNDQTDLEPSENVAPTPIASAGGNCGNGRLAQKIERLHQRREATQRKLEATGSGPTSVFDDPVTSTSLAVPGVMDTNINVYDEPEPETQLTRHRSTMTPAYKRSRRSTVTDTLKEMQVETEVGAAPSFPLLTARSMVSSQRARLSEPPRAPPDLVSRLRGVMNSSELTHPPQSRPPGGGHVTSPSEIPTNSLSLTSAPSRNSFSGILKQAPLPLSPLAPPTLPPFNETRPTTMASAAPTPVQSTTIYVCYDPEDQCHKVYRRKLGQRSFIATEAIKARPDDVPASKEDNEKEHGKDDNYLSFSNNEQGQAQNSAFEDALPPASALRSDRRARVCDESCELRELMEGLAKAPLRSRCSSGQSTGAPPTEKLTCKCSTDTLCLTTSGHDRCRKV